MLLVVSVAIGGCNQPTASPDGAPDDQAVPAITATAAETVVAPTPNASTGPSPTQTPISRDAPGAHPLDVVTGVGVVDAFLAALAARDHDSIAGLVTLLELPCSISAREGPECPAGVPAGSTVSVFPVAGCEPFFDYRPRDDIARGLAETLVTYTTGVYAVYERTTAAHDLGRGAFGVLLVNGSAPEQAPQVFLDDQGRIVEFWGGCAPADMSLPESATLILAPLGQ